MRTVGLVAAALILSSCASSIEPAPDTTAVNPPPTTSLAAQTTVPVSSGFFEGFDDNGGIERFRHGVFHRDVDTHEGGTHRGGSWEADHDMFMDGDCGDPAEHSHTVDAADREASIFVCRDHMMTTMGDVDGYSVVWFSADQVFNDENYVAWAVNSTYLGGRQWWEVAIVPMDGPDVSCIEWLPCDTDHYPSGAVVVSSRDITPRLWADDAEVDLTWQRFCFDDEYSLDPEGCESKALRRQWSLTDNANGTLTIRFLDHSWTSPGRFPQGPFKVVFKDHSYTPDKDNDPVGYTWHWDDITIGSR